MKALIQTGHMQLLLMARGCSQSPSPAQCLDHVISANTHLQGQELQGMCVDRIHWLLVFWGSLLGVLSSFQSEGSSLRNCIHTQRFLKP